MKGLYQGVWLGGRAHLIIQVAWTKQLWTLGLPRTSGQTLLLAHLGPHPEPIGLVGDTFHVCSESTSTMGTSFSNPRSGRGSGPTSHGQRPRRWGACLDTLESGALEKFLAVPPRSQRCGDHLPWFAQDWKNQCPVKPLGPGGRKMG